MKRHKEERELWEPRGAISQKHLALPEPQVIVLSLFQLILFPFSLRERFSPGRTLTCHPARMCYLTEAMLLIKLFLLHPLYTSPFCPRFLH